jgi:TolB-like protein
MAEVKAALSNLAARAASQEIPSIAVLPFANLTADAQNDYFSDGLAEEVLSALAKVPGLRVIARASAFAFRGRTEDLLAIGAKLNVGVILEGSVRRAGNRVRVSAQLIQLADESQLWSERYDREMTDIFAIQDEIARAIADALKVKLTARRAQATNLAAYHNYLKGLYHYQRYSQEGLGSAKKAFDQSLAEDPNYAPAYAGLASFYYTLALLGIRRMTEVAPLAKSAAQKALAIDPTLNDAHSILGVISTVVDHDWTSAERHFRTGMALDPVPSLVRVRYALFCLAWQGRYEEALEEFERALETDPLSMIVYFGLTLAHYWNGDFQSAIALAAKGLEINPNFFFVQLTMGMAKFHAGHVEDAITCLEKTLQIAPWYSVAGGFLAASHVRVGHHDLAAQMIAQWTDRAKTAYVSGGALAIYYGCLGDAGRTFDFLDVAFKEHDPNLVSILGEPLFFRFRSNPRYRDLLRRLNLPFPLDPPSVHKV